VTVITFVKLEIPRHLALYHTPQRRKVGAGYLQEAARRGHVGRRRFVFSANRGSCAGTHARRGKKKWAKPKLFEISAR